MIKDYPPLLQKSSELVEAWRKTLQAFDQFSKQSVKGCFFHMKMKVMLKILHHLSEENKLSIYDEKIFEYFDHLMNHYQKTIQLFQDNEQEIKTGKAKEILSGICTVLSSQLKQFRENQMVEQGISDPKASVNPIKAEKEKFLMDEKINILNQLDDLEDQWTKEEMEKTLLSLRKHLIDLAKDDTQQVQCVKEIYEGLIQNLKGPLYKCYAKKSKKGIEKLNDFHLRKAANFYYESIKQEKENVEAIIKIQVNALEEEMKNEAYEDREQQIIQEILHTIREAYQHLGKEIEELEQFFKEAEKQPNKIHISSPEEFETYLKVQGMDAYVNDLNVKSKLNYKDREIVEFNENYNAFNQIWNEFKKELFNHYNDKINQDNLLRRIDLKLQNNMELSQKIIQSFSDFYEKTKKGAGEIVETEYTPIIEGIGETIHIKIESLKESLELFSEIKNEMLQRASEEFKEFISEKDFEKITEDLFEKFMIESMNEFPLEESDFTKKQLAFLDGKEEEGMAFLSDRLLRRQEKIEQEADKRIIKFLREHLLFEMSTYEEIINYSVSKLRESQEDFIITYVKEIDALTHSIEEILKAYKIEFIHPNPHEKFNGKEHEVLMAEVREGFQKGEIIKTMNKGYMLDGQIILKANVIAGK
ncbi:nucleotide exchange factor GrpE [Defluviitalea raffinosedens]|uniref:Nucleotide exchange factor GrpE n=1 Tax=Defluviitalea raffinosedens TaxID=1450156 RepID=A0A7C8HF77_9FIRM|nr:nucleotide exchange factor GrpE [Defluviitalea raffinosedens]KAE9633454.1 nucleotide exchange factor GrpE [Defluviitalea raffinosedens]